MYTCVCVCPSLSLSLSSIRIQAPRTCFGISTNQWVLSGSFQATEGPMEVVDPAVRSKGLRAHRCPKDLIQFSHIFSGYILTCRSVRLPESKVFASNRDSFRVARMLVKPLQPLQPLEPKYALVILVLERDGTSKTTGKRRTELKNSILRIFAKEKSSLRNLGSAAGRLRPSHGQWTGCELVGLALGST